MTAKWAGPRSWLGTCAGLPVGLIRVGKLSARLDFADKEHTRANLLRYSLGGGWPDPSVPDDGSASGVGKSVQAG